MLRAIATVGVDTVDLAKGVVYGMVHGTGGDKCTEKGHLFAGRVSCADHSIEPAQFALGLHEQFDRMGILGVGGDGLGIGIQQTRA